MNAEIFAALAQLEKERGIPQAYMIDKITQALVAAYKKDKDGYTDNVFVEVVDNDMKTSSTTSFWTYIFISLSTTSTNTLSV